MKLKMNKQTWIVIGIILIVCVGVGVWRVTTNRQKGEVIPGEEPARNINVSALSSDNENQIKTIIYAGAKLQGEITTSDNNKVATLETTDSEDGAFNIYYQDLLNRYKSYKVDKTEITKDDALGGKAKKITVHGTEGTITVVVWPKTNGMTQIEIATSADFQ